MKYSNRRKYRDQSIEIIEETVVKKTTKKVKKKNLLTEKVKGFFKKLWK